MPDAMKWFTRKHNRQVAVFDEYGRLRSVSADVADAMGWGASPPSARTDDDNMPLCDFCGAPMQPGAAPGVVVCDHCNVQRMYDSQ